MSLVGRHIGRYRILEQLGQGGMSVVYKGLDTTLEREVAVKVLHPHLSGKEESRKRLAREAKAVAKLHHPNILEVFDFAGVDSEDAYIVTEYIRGQTLRDFVAAQALDPPEIAAMVIHEIAAALAHAHETGVIHRDLKPENVMVREDGVLKLMDFGIAKIVDRDERMTMTGALVGSPAHMAPEIIEGEEAGAEADVFSLGTMLYAFATGRLPFSAPNTTAVLKRILDGQFDDPRRIQATVSDELAEIIATCLMRAPAARYAHAGLLRDALAKYLSSVGLDHVSEELASFFADPPSYRKQLSPRMTAALIQRAERLVSEQRQARALSALNQVLALDPTHGRALELVQQMNRARRRSHLRARALRVAAGIAALAGLAVTGGMLLRRPPPAPDYRPAQLERPTEVALAADLFAAPPPPPEPVVAPAPAAMQARPAVPKKLAPLTVRVRPFGFVRIDGGSRSEEETAMHRLQLPEGRHRISVNCSELCDEIHEEVTLEGEQPRELLVAVRLKPSKLSFNYEPAGATVRLGNEQRSVAETRAQPFLVVTPRERTRSLRHEVEFEISAPGFKTERRKIPVTPGSTLEINGKLEPQ